MPDEGSRRATIAVPPTIVRGKDCGSTDCLSLPGDDDYNDGGDDDNDDDENDEDDDDGNDDDDDDEWEAFASSFKIRFRISRSARSTKGAPPPFLLLLTTWTERECSGVGARALELPSASERIRKGRRRRSAAGKVP
jgi:hypothetical protein